jgi:hypothetical protein
MPRTSAGAHAPSSSRHRGCGGKGPRDAELNRKKQEKAEAPRPFSEIRQLVEQHQVRVESDDYNFRTAPASAACT